jgi:hypothetical protein
MTNSSAVSTAGQADREFPKAVFRRSRGEGGRREYRYQLIFSDMEDLPAAPLGRT